MRRRTLIPMLVAVAVVLALGVMSYLRAKAPPEAARLLPEADAIVYIDLKPIRLATHFDKPGIPRTPQLQQFIDATGIVPERDIDAAAFSLHRVPVPGSDLHAADLFVSEVFLGHFDAEKLSRYLDSIATAKESYAGRTVYTVRMGTGEQAGETLRIAQLDYDTLAASNMPTSEQIHSMLDRSRASGLATSGSSLLAARFQDVPLLSEVWAIGHLGLPFSQNGHIAAMGLQLPLAEDADLVASLRYTPTSSLLSGGAVQLRVQQIAPTAAAAQNTADTLTAMLGMVRSAGTFTPTQTPNDQTLRQILDTIHLQQHGTRAELDASATVDQLKTLFAPKP